MSGSSSSATRPARPAPAGAAAIEVSHLTKTFGARTAVADVSFSVARGEVFGFLGPNGAGKTTTVRILGTLIAPTSGSAVVAGLPLDPAENFERQKRVTPFTALWNVSGQPAVNVPLRWSADGLPIGVMLAGRMGDEATLISLSAQLEQARPWKDRHPPLW